MRGPAPGVSVSVSAHDDGPVIPDVLLPPPSLSLSPCLGRDLTGNSQPQLPANSRTGRIKFRYGVIITDNYRLYWLNVKILLNY